MFAELIFVVLAIFVLLLVDNWSTLFGLILCIVLVYFFVYNFPHILNKRAVVLIITKLWLCLIFCFRIASKIFRLIQRIFYSKSRYSASNNSNIQFCGEEARFEHEIHVLVQNITKHFINSWYSKISANQEFVSYLNNSINESLSRMCISISKTDKKRFSYLILQIYLNFFSHFIEAKKKSDIIRKENFEMKHWALKDNLSEWCYLQSLISAILDIFCPNEYERSLHSKQSPLLHTLVVEILTENIMHPLVKLLCDPFRLNTLLLKLLMNFSITVEQNAVICKTNTDENIVSPKLSFVNSPIILLPSDDHQTLTESDGHEIEGSAKPISLNRLSIPDDRFYARKHDSDVSIDEIIDQDTDDDYPSFVSSGKKSSSNINLSNHVFSDFEAPEYSISTSPIHETSIKRSRSADYIRQMPKLKALNEKEYNILQKDSNKMCIALKADINSSNYIEQAEEAFEVEIPALFSNVKIIDTYQENDSGLHPFTLYCIQYVGVFHDTEKSSDSPCFVKQVVNVKRRFREFVNLHSRLEDNTSLKNCLKGIKGPSKWVVLPFSNLDKKNIAERRLFLENYLKELCSSVHISHSSELQEFLAYGVDDMVSYIRKPIDISVPRIDKMLVRGVKGAFDIIKTALPNPPLEEENSLKIVYDDQLSDQRFQEHLLDYSSREPEIKEHIMNFIETSTYKYNVDDWKSRGSSYRKSSLLRYTRFKPVDCCTCPTLKENQYEEENPFGNIVMELIAVACKSDERNLGDLLSTMKILCSPCINRFCVSKLDKIADHHLITALHYLHKLLWPEEKSSSEQSLKTEHSIPNLIMQNIEELLSQRSILQKMGFAIKPFLLEKISLFLSSIQHEEINKCLLFHMFDAVLESLCSKEMQTLFL